VYFYTFDKRLYIVSVYMLADSALVYNYIYFLWVYRINSNAEWDSYLQIATLRKILPIVYGYFEVPCAGGFVAVLLLERVAFTFDDFVRKSREYAPIRPTVDIIKACVLRVYHTLVECARDGLYAHDWHVANVGFTDTSASRMVLVDWQKNKLASADLSYRQRFEKALRCFIQFLPGPHMYGEDVIIDKAIDVQANIRKWRIVLTRMSSALQSWWDDVYSSGNLLPTAGQSATLEGSLLHIVDTFDAVVVPPVVVREREPSVGSPAVFLTASIPAVWVGHQPIDMDVRPIHEAASSSRGPAVPSDVSAEGYRAMQAVIKVVRVGNQCVRVGAVAVDGLLAEVMRAHRLHVQKPYRFAPTCSVRSMTLGDRIARGRFTAHMPTQCQAEGDDVKAFFNLILTLMSPMIRDRLVGIPPQAAWDKEFFHHRFWKKVVKYCPPRPWLSLTLEEKGAHLRAFFFRMFTLDPFNRCMLPSVGMKRMNRNDASWVGFWMTDTELDGVISAALCAYVGS
jgi:hypothetical protein